MSYEISLVILEQFYSKNTPFFLLNQKRLVNPVYLFILTFYYFTYLVYSPSFPFLPSLLYILKPSCQLYPSLSPSPFTINSQSASSTLTILPSHRCLSTQVHALSHSDTGLTCLFCKDDIPFEVWRHLRRHYQKRHSAKMNENLTLV